MKIKLLKDYAEYPAGKVIVVSDSTGRRLAGCGICKPTKDATIHIKPVGVNSQTKYQNKMMNIKE